MNKVILYEREAAKQMMGSFLKVRLIPVRNLTFLKRLYRRGYERGRKDERRVIMEERL